MFLSVLPLAIATVCLLVAAEKQTNFGSISEYALAYEHSVDKEKYLAEFYPKVKDIDERQLPADQMAFVIKVKISQFIKQ